MHPLLLQCGQLFEILSVNISSQLRLASVDMLMAS